MTEALVIYSCMLCNKYFLTYAWGRNKSDALEALKDYKLYLTILDCY